MSDTPRTDAFERDTTAINGAKALAFARELERENTRLTTALAEVNARMEEAERSLYLWLSAEEAKNEALAAELAEAQRNKVEQARHCQELTAQLIEARELLRVAKCPQCNGSGVVEYGLRPVCCGNARGNECCGDPIGEPDIGPCQWCDERDHAIDRASTGEAG